MKAYIDANVFVLSAFGTGEKGLIATGIMEKLQSGTLEGTTCSLTIDEFMWAVLRQKHGHRLHELTEALYETPNLSIVETPADAPRVALKFMRAHALRPRDAIHCAVMQRFGISTIFSDDADFDRVKGITRKF